MKIRLLKKWLPKKADTPIEGELVEAKDNDDEVLLALPPPEDIEAKYSGEFAEDSFWNKCKRYATSIGRGGLKNAFILYYALRSNKLDFRHKAAVLGALGYLISFIDAVPDLTPIIGYTDDLAILSAAVMAIADVIDDDVKQQAEAKVVELLGSYTDKI